MFYTPACSSCRLVQWPISVLVQRTCPHLLLDRFCWESMGFHRRPSPQYFGHAHWHAFYSHQFRYLDINGHGYYQKKKCNKERTMGSFLLLFGMFWLWLRQCGGNRRFSVATRRIITGGGRVRDAWPVFTWVTGSRFGMRRPRCISWIDCWWWRLGRWRFCRRCGRSLGIFNKFPKRREFKHGNIVFVIYRRMNAWGFRLLICLSCWLRNESQHENIHGSSANNVSIGPGIDCWLTTCNPNNHRLKQTS